MAEKTVRQQYEEILILRLLLLNRMLASLISRNLDNAR